MRACGEPIPFACYDMLRTYPASWLHHSSRLILQRVPVSAILVLALLLGLFCALMVCVFAPQLELLHVPIGIYTQHASYQFKKLRTRLSGHSSVPLAAAHSSGARVIGTYDTHQLQPVCDGSGTPIRRDIVDRKAILEQAFPTCFRVFAHKRNQTV